MPDVRYPRTSRFNQAWLVLPARNSDAVELLRGPNIAVFLRFYELPESLEGEVLLKGGDNVSADIIMPAGNRVLPYRSNIPAISDFVFDVLDVDFAARTQVEGGAMGVLIFVGERRILARLEISARQRGKLVAGGVLHLHRDAHVSGMHREVE